jgi:hypothetical protein
MKLIHMYCTATSWVQVFGIGSKAVSELNLISGVSTLVTSTDVGDAFILLSKSPGSVYFPLVVSVPCTSPEVSPGQCEMPKLCCGCKAIAVVLCMQVCTCCDQRRRDTCRQL